MIAENLWSWLFAVSVWLLATGWLWQLWQWMRHSHEVADLTKIQPKCLPPLTSLVGEDHADAKPDLAVIVPACNEDAAIAATLGSLLASIGLRLQIVAVDDRSTDRTGEIMERMARAERGRHSIQVVHIGELPPGWLGKPHALATGAKLADAEWLLFTDGDVLFAPQALWLALRYALAEQADHLVLMPDWVEKSHGEAAMQGAIHALSAWALRLWRVADPEARDFIGVGAFNLVRRTAYEELGGFHALRMEVIEDMRLGWMVKRAGYRQRVVLGPGLASVRWADGAWAVVRNLEKNLFALYRYRIWLVSLGCLGLALQIVWPLAALFAGGWARAGAIVLYLAIAALYAASRRVTRVSPWYVLLYPPAAGLFLFAILRSVVLALARGGVEWRGTRYSLRELRAHAGRFW